MAKSRRTKLIALTKTAPKKAIRQKQMRRMQSNSNGFPRAFVLGVDNMCHENQSLLRAALPGALLFGRKALARRFFADRAEAGADELAAFLDAGADCLLLFFSESTREEVEALLATLHADEFGRAGSAATATLRLAAGAEALSSLPVAAEESLRALGLDVEVADGRLRLLRPFEAATRGQPLSAVQARLLRALGVKAAEFRPRLLALWDRVSGEFTQIAA